MADEVVFPRRQTLWLSGAVLLTLAAVALLAHGLGTPIGAPLPPVLLWTLPVGSAVSLLFGFRAGKIAFGACLLGVLLFLLTHPLIDPAAKSARFNLLISLATLQLFVFGFQSTFERAKAFLREQQGVIRLRLEEHARLVETLVSDVQARLSAMLPHLRDGRFVGHAELRVEQHALHELLRRAQRSLVPEVRTEFPGRKLDLRLRVLQWILVITFLEVIPLQVRVALGHPGPVWPGVGLMLTCVVLFALLRRRPAWRWRIALAFTLASHATLLGTSVFWGYAVPPPSMVYIITIAYHAVLIGLPFSGLAVATLNVAAVALAVAMGAAQTPGAALYLFGIAVCALAMQGYWHLMNLLVLSSFRALEARRLELMRVEGFRTRICGTLFHDVANLVQGMNMLVAFDDTSAEDAWAFQRLHARLSKLVKAAADTMNDDNAMQTARLDAVSLDEVFAEAHELFAFRLRQKEQSLVCSLSEPLSVTAQPDLLRDSVLANLISNAIKFSPRGAAIRLSAKRQAGKVEIRVSDRGPGWPEGLAERLREGARVASTQGSQGEQGLGLGLTLTREHLLRMGGSLALQRAPGGGSEAVVALNAAN